ncbi:NADH-cytochrome b5 reductase-like [Dispira simplex]|nr:NADH-cytochrome b5 reductase-like [Dispira simplex]
MGKDGGIERSTNPQVLEYLREVARLKEKAQQHVSKRDATSDRNNITTTPSAKPTACLVGIYRENDTLKLRLPRTPTPPGPDDCCQSGCTPCILESYQDELLAHKQVVAALQAEYTAQLKQYDGSVPKVTSDSSGTKSAVLDTQNRLSEDDRAGKPLLVSRFQPFVATQVDTINHNSIRVVCKPTIPLDLASNQSLLIHAGYHVFLRGFRGRLEEATSLVMLAAGSGITPMYQYLQTIFNTPSLQHLQVCLVHCNRTLSDIWLRDTLENLAQLHPQFTLHHVLSHEQLGMMRHYEIMESETE